MKKLMQVFQFFHGSLICLLPSLILIGNFSIGVATAVISPLFCTAVLPVCRTDRRLWTFLWASEALTAVNIVLMKRAEAFASLLFDRMPPQVISYILLFSLLFAAEQALYAVAVALIWKKKESPSPAAPQEKGTDHEV